MRFPLHVVALLLLVASLLINLAFWGGVSTSKVLGPIVPDAVRLQAPLAYTWLVIGDAAARARLGRAQRLAEAGASPAADPAADCAAAVVASAARAENVRRQVISRGDFRGDPAARAF